MNTKKLINELSYILFYPGTEYKNHVQCCLDELNEFDELKILFSDFNTYVQNAPQS